MRISAASVPVKSWFPFACLLCSGITQAAQLFRSWTEPVTGIVFVALPKGCFKMGAAKLIDPPSNSNWERIGYKGKLAQDEMPRHEVCVDAFWMAKTEVSEGDWDKVMGGAAPGGAGRRAKVGVTWLQAQQFAQRLSAQSAGKLHFRLPTEAEWEYACRAGSAEHPDAQLEQPGQLAERAWYGNSPRRSYEASEVGLLQANPFGLHDMLGNAWEWTQDSYRSAAYARHALYNPKVEAVGAPRVIRGGSFRTEFAQTRCAVRGHYEPAHTLDIIGMRLVRER